MSAIPQLMRGSVLKCMFPYEDNPNRPGPKPHYCLFIDQFEYEGSIYVIVAYGTSRLDKQLMNAHRVLDVPTEFLDGSKPENDQGVIHFLCDHVAILPLKSEWVNMRFSSRLGCFNESHLKDPRRKNLLAKLSSMDRVLVNSACVRAKSFAVYNEPGLNPGATLR